MAPDVAPRDADDARSDHPPERPPPPPPPALATRQPQPSHRQPLRPVGVLENGKHAGIPPPSVAAQRPGLLFQSQLFQDFYSTVVPSSFSSPATGTIWLTPPDASPRFNHHFVSNLLSFLLSAPPERLQAVCHRPFVFSACVASQNIANYVVAQGALRLGSAVFLLHATMEAACKRAEQLQLEETFTPQPPENSKGRNYARSNYCAQQRWAQDASRSAAPLLSHQHLPLASLNPAMLSPKKRLGSRLTDPVNVSPVPFHHAAQHSAPSPLDTQTSPYHAAATPTSPREITPPPPKSYLAALLSKTSHPPPLKPSFTFIPPPNGCFRCLASNHCVRDCRDPVRCRNCGDSGHRQYACPMPLARLLTPGPRCRHRVVRINVQANTYIEPAEEAPAMADGGASPVPAAGDDAIPVPPQPASTVAAPRASPPPSPTAMNTPPPPPSPQCSPLSCIGRATSVSSSTIPHFMLNTASSSHSAPKPQWVDVAVAPECASPPRAHHLASADNDPPLPAADEGADEASRRTLRCRTTRSHHHPHWRPTTQSTQMSLVASPKRKQTTAMTARLLLGPQPVRTAQTTWRFGCGRAWWTWLQDVPSSTCTLLKHPPEAGANPAPVIQQALFELDPTLTYEMLPSSRGVMLVRFGSHMGREMVMNSGPLDHEDVRVEFERAEDTSNRFIRPTRWLAAVSASDFPIEHWYADGIRDAFSYLGTVIEIAPACLTGFNYSSVRVVVQLTHRSNVPASIWVMNLGGETCDVPITVLRKWPKALQFNAQGQWIPFFGSPPPLHNLGLPPFWPPPQAQLPPPPQHEHDNPPHAPHAANNQNHMHALPLSPPPPTITELPPDSPELISHTRPAAALLALPWHGVTHASPPATLNATAPAPPAAAPTRNAARRGRAIAVPQRCSERLAKKDAGKYVKTGDKAEHLKNLRNDLKNCSKEMKTRVKKGVVLRKSATTMSTRDLRNLATVAGLSSKANNAGSGAQIVPNV